MIFVIHIWISVLIIYISHPRYKEIKYCAMLLMMRLSIASIAKAKVHRTEICFFSPRNIYHTKHMVGIAFHIKGPIFENSKPGSFVALAGLVIHWFPLKLEISPVIKENKNQNGR